MRGGEMAALREVPFGLYYGSVDSTPLFVLLAGLYAERTGDTETIAELWPAHRSGAGLDRRTRRSATATASSNTSAQPSRVSPTKAGRIPTTRSSMPTAAWRKGAIALAEVQGYVYAAKRMAARCARRLGRSEAAHKLDAEARPPRRAFRGRVLVPGDRDLCAGARRRQEALPRAHLECRPGAVHRHRRGRSRRAWSPTVCCRPHFFSGWGIRTVARGEARYNPMSYHNGSIWPHDNALIALGLGALRTTSKRSRRCSTDCSAPAPIWIIRRLPELFCGFQTQRGHGPTLYPVACAPQAWASATPFTLLEASLGLQFDPFKGEIRLCNPRLPPFLDEVILRNLQLGSSSVDLRVRRHGHTVSLDTPRIQRRYPGFGRLFLVIRGRRGLRPFPTLDPREPAGPGSA